MSELTYLNKLKDKCDLDDNFINIIENLFAKLIDFGYISKSDTKKLAKRMYENIDTVIIKNEDTLDYKSGYYDPIKKELYLKNVNNLEATYLRLLYVLTTVKDSKLSQNSFFVGYSKVFLSHTDYKIVYKYFGINRAILSNLVCRLLYTSPTTLEILPGYRTYKNNFLGYTIDSSNDIYFLEAKLFSQMITILDISEEDFYYNLFNNNNLNNYILSSLNKSKINFPIYLLDLFDNISRRYSNYNKLCYLNDILNNYYILSKKNNKDLNLEIRNINHIINDSIKKLDILPENLQVESESNYDVFETNITEKMDLLEEKLVELISNLQDILFESFVSEKLKFDPLEYVVKLKKLQKLSIIENKILKSELCNTITSELLQNGEALSTNITEKIKFSILNELIEDEKINIYKHNVSFNKIIDSDNITKDFAYILLNKNNSVVELLNVSNLNDPINELSNNILKLHIENLKHLLNTDIDNSYSQKIESIFSKLKEFDNTLKNIELENIFLCELENFNFLIILKDGIFNVIKFIEMNDAIEFIKLSLSPSYTILGNTSNSNNLPVLYSNKTNIFQQVILFILSIGKRQV